MERGNIRGKCRNSPSTKIITGWRRISPSLAPPMHLSVHGAPLSRPPRIMGAPLQRAMLAWSAHAPLRSARCCDARLALTRRRGALGTCAELTALLARECGACSGERTFPCSLSWLAFVAERERTRSVPRCSSAHAPPLGSRVAQVSAFCASNFFISLQPRRRRATNPDGLPFRCTFTIIRVFYRTCGLSDVATSFVNIQPN